MGLDAGAQSPNSQDEAIARLHKPQSTFVEISGFVSSSTNHPQSSSRNFSNCRNGNRTRLQGPCLVPALKKRPNLFFNAQCIMHNWHSPSCGWLNKRSNMVLGPAQGTAPAVGCFADNYFMRLGRNFMPRQFSTHEKYPLNQHGNPQPPPHPYKHGECPL